MKVVIIDDDKSSGKALADLLETKYDMEVLGCALCGLDGLAMVNRYQPDVLFLDVQLPDVNGLDFLDKLSGFVHRRCQVVMYTAYDEYILTAFRKQAFDVLLKPINPQELDTIVRRLEKEAEKEAEKELEAEKETEKEAEKEAERVVGAGVKNAPVANGKLLFYTNSVDFRLVDKENVCLFQYNHEVRCWEVVVADNRKPIRLKRSVKSTDLLALAPHFMQVNQKFIVNINYLIEVVDNVCHFYPPFDEIDYVKVGRLYRKKLIDRFLSI